MADEETKPEATDSGPQPITLRIRDQVSEWWNRKV